MCDSERALCQTEDICRDFLRNVCNRGKKCKFKHVNSNNNCSNALDEKKKFCKDICHDFQNTSCNRDGCKFIHCSKDDQLIFMESGKLSNQVLEDAIIKNVIPFLSREAPVCRDYLIGECRRGKSCRFRHLSRCKYKIELNQLFGVQNSIQESCISNGNVDIKRMKSYALCPILGPSSDQSFVSQSSPSFSQACYAQDKCNSHICGNERYSSITQHVQGPCSVGPVSYTTEGYCEHSQEAHIPLCNGSLQEENSMLKKQIFNLRRQVSDLMTANEFLLEQNAALRIMRKNGGIVAIQPSPSTAALNVQTAPGQQLVASAVPVSIAPVSGGAPGQMTLSTVAMTGQGSTQQLVPVSCHAQGQQIMAAVNTVTVAGQTGSAALLATAVPVSVSSTASQLVPVSAVPVSLSMAPVHMPPIVTAASQTPHSIAMSASAATSLVSYPIMTQQLLQTR